MFDGLTSRCTRPNLVGGVQCRGDLLNDPDRPQRIEGATGQDRLQVVTVDQPHRHEQASLDLTEVMNWHHVWLVESGRCLRLPPEPFPEDLIVREVRGQHLQRHHPIDRGVERPPDLAHAAPAQQLDQAVASERRPVHITP